MIYPDEAMLYAPAEWHDCSEGFTDIRYEKSADGIAKITINRPQVRNAFRPLTVKEMIQALADARYDDNVGVIILTGAGDKAFCAGGDQKVRGDYGGYQDDSGVHHLNVLDFQRQIRTCPKPVVAMVAGFSIGGGVRYVGSSYANTDNSLKVPAATVYDARLGYDWREWGVALNAANLTNKTYLATCQNNGCEYAMKRQLTATVSYKW